MKKRTPCKEYGTRINAQGGRSGGIKKLPAPVFVRVFLILTLLSLAGCQGVAPEVETPTPGKTLTPTLPSPAATLDPQNLATTTSPASLSGPVTLRLWLPPQWDPASGTQVGDLLNVRLRTFEAQNPAVQIEVRLKELEGAGGLLESLAAANTAAPLALPDLIALPRPLLESAALKGLLYPFDGLTEVMQEDSWYEYARQLSQLQSSTFGLPFAGDVLLLAYRPAVLEVPPRDWHSAQMLGNALVFPAADRQALFTLCQYQALGGVVQDDQGRPYLDEAILTEVLTFYQQASQAGLMPYWLTQFETDEQTWRAFGESQAPMAATWASRFLNESNTLPILAAFAPLLTPDGTPFTLANGWVWALASSDPTRRALAAQLADFLVDEQFLAAWTGAAGYLPPRSGALDGWQDASLHSLIDSISRSAQLPPAGDLLSSLGPVLQEAVIQVLKQQSDGQTAAQTAAGRINTP